MPILPHLPPGTMVGWVQAEADKHIQNGQKQNAFNWVAQRGAIGPDSQHDMADFCSNYRFRRWAQVKKGWVSSYSIPVSSLPPPCQRLGQTGWGVKREPKSRARSP